MAEIATIRLNAEWAERTKTGCGGVAAFGAALGVDKGTASRHLRGKSEAGPRFIGAVLTTFAVTFDEAFDVVHEDVSATSHTIRRAS
ncbi:hypothetical protein [Cellulomonas gilvus]|uniref:Uncharacterized protein n=1 Tax=Cellulomonas gilvus (strain ATCC 13127 / NRRL B-14078) TaxID=593907 RepID=F8A301_CELGA|nr:hypothetical protein [Cellulomonas gilvus]AEI11856.1 hypothetical protein Celgi_1337 [Cellulomonas gilvus ATCC 13127]